MMSEPVALSQRKWIFQMNFTYSTYTLYLLKNINNVYSVCEFKEHIHRCLVVEQDGAATKWWILQSLSHKAVPCFVLFCGCQKLLQHILNLKQNTITQSFYYIKASCIIEDLYLVQVAESTVMQQHQQDIIELCKSLKGLSSEN